MARSPVGWVAALLLLGACLHPWDDYEAPEPANGTGGVGGADPLCVSYCQAYEDCFGSTPSCSSDCASQIGACDSEQRDKLEGCATLLLTCANGSVSPSNTASLLEACLYNIACYSP